MANACFFALQPVCGHKALDFARCLNPQGEQDVKNLAAAQSAAELIRRWERLAGRAALESSLELADILLRLGRTREAEQVFLRLRAEHPRDARPCTGLVRVAMARGLRLAEAERWVEAGAGLDHRDREYYQLAIGVAAQSALRGLMHLAEGKHEQIVP